MASPLAELAAAGGWSIALASSDPASEKAKTAVAAVAAKAAGGTTVTVAKPLTATAAADVIIIALPGATTAAGVAEYAGLIAGGGAGKVIIDVVGSSCRPRPLIDATAGVRTATAHSIQVAPHVPWLTCPQTNPIGASFATELHGMTSVGEEFAKLLPTAHVFKAFNT